MFTFLTPAFFMAGLAAAASIPILLHFAEKKRRVKMQFSWVKLLKSAEKKSSRNLKLENFLLWLLRTILLLLIGVSFGLPILRTTQFGKFLGRTDRDIAIIIDTSYSMQYSTGKDDVWNKTIQTARAIIEGLNEDDNICIFAADEFVNPIIETLQTDKEYALSQLKIIETKMSESKLCPAVLAGYEALKKDERQREREIHILTDGQMLPWVSFGRMGAEAAATPDKDDKDKKKKTDKKPEKKKPASSKTPKAKAPSMAMWKPENIDDKTAIFVTFTGVTSPENQTPVHAEVQPELIMSDMPFKVQAGVRNSGPEKSISIKLFIDDEEVGERAMKIPADGEDSSAIVVSPLSPGPHIGRIETPADNLACDNTFNFLIHIKEKLPTLCVGTRDNTFFLMKALHAGGPENSTMKIDTLQPSQLGGLDPLKYSCIFLCNVLPLQGPEIAKMEHYVRSGGLLVIFPGDKASLSDYSAWSCLPGKPVGIVDVPLKKRRKILSWMEPKHSLLASLRLQPGIAPIISISKMIKWSELHKDTKPLVSAGGEDHFLLDRTVGRGKVLVFSVAANRSWSTFPLSPFYLPFAHKTVEYGARVSESEAFTWTTPSLPISDFIPEATEQTDLTYPDGKKVSIRGTKIGNKTILRAEDIMQDGIYMMSREADPEPKPALAVNLPRVESNLFPVNRTEIYNILGSQNKVYVASGKDELIKMIEDYRVGRSLGEFFLWAVLIVAVVEGFYANHKSKESSKLTDKLNIEASGKLNDSE